MIRENPHRLLEKNATDVATFLDRALDARRRQKRRVLALCSGAIGLVLFGVLLGSLMTSDGGSSSSTRIEDRDPNDPDLTWGAGSRNGAVRKRLFELNQSRQPDDILWRLEVKDLLATVSFDDIRPDLGDINSVIATILVSIRHARGFEYIEQVEEWLASPHTDRRVKRLADRALAVIDEIDVDAEREAEAEARASGRRQPGR